MLLLNLQKALEGASPHRFRPRYAGANLGHPSTWMRVHLDEQQIESTVIPAGSAALARGRHRGMPSAALHRLFSARLSTTRRLPRVRGEKGPRYRPRARLE